MTTTRVALGVFGFGLCVVGAYRAVTDLTTSQLLGLALWLAAAVVVHDGLIAPATAALSTLLERLGTHLRPSARGVVRVGFVVAAVLSLAVVPEIAAQTLGNPNPTVLTGPYVVRLSWSLLSIAFLTIGGVVVAQRNPRRHDA